MKLKALTLENFKGISSPVRIELSPLTLLFGPNNAGKSTIVQALMYAREILEHNNTDPRKTALGGSTVDLGGFHSLVHNHQTDRMIKMRFEMSFSPEVPGNWLADYETLCSQLKSVWVEIEVGYRPSPIPGRRIEDLQDLDFCQPGCSYLPVVQAYSVGIKDNVYARVSLPRNTNTAVLEYFNFGTPPFGTRYKRDNESDFSWDLARIARRKVRSSLPEFFSSMHNLNDGASIADHNEDFGVPDNQISRSDFDALILDIIHGNGEWGNAQVDPRTGESNEKYRLRQEMVSQAKAVGRYRLLHNIVNKYNAWFAEYLRLSGTENSQEAIPLLLGKILEEITSPYFLCENGVSQEDAQRLSGSHPEIKSLHDKAILITEKMIPSQAVLGLLESFDRIGGIESIHDHQKIDAYLKILTQIRQGDLEAELPREGDDQLLKSSGIAYDFLEEEDLDSQLLGDFCEFVRSEFIPAADLHDDTFFPGRAFGRFGSGMLLQLLDSALPNLKVRRPLLQEMCLAPLRSKDMEDAMEKNKLRSDFLDFLEEIIVGPGRALLRILKNSVYLGPARRLPFRDYYHEETDSESEWASGLAAWDRLMAGGSQPLVDRVNHWLTSAECFNTGYRIELQRYRKLDLELWKALMDGAFCENDGVLRQKLAALPEKTQKLEILNIASGIALAPQDLGVGLSQLLPVVVAALHTMSGVVAIEEPESNIHPALQVVLADLFITQAKANPDALFLVETHSEHLMLRCLRRIRETTEGHAAKGEPSFSPEDIAVHFVEPSEAGPRIHRIRIDEDGEFMDPWPKGFFPERMKEVYGDDL